MQVESLVSYAILSKNEGESLHKLLNSLYNKKHPLDEIVIVDDDSVDEYTLDILKEASSKGCIVKKHSLNNDFATQKNYLNSLCKNPYIFNIDADEYISDDLQGYLKELLDYNQNIEMFKVPRINIVDGITENHLKKWYWRLLKNDKYTITKTLDINSDEFKLLKNNNFIISDNGNNVFEYYRPIIQFPDYQYRIYKNMPHIFWRNKVHEFIFGYKTYAALPDEYSLIHIKDIKRQEKQNKFYENL